jgi:ligand-binding SRPBCC domain-containing protein
MPVIVLYTRIAAPRERVFDLARSLDLHQDTVAQTRERAVAGVTSGLLGLDEEVTWSAWHLGWRRRLRVRMYRLEYPSFFEDRMVEGAFRMMRHEHHFEQDGEGTVMMDRFEFESPFGWLGGVFDRRFLEGYMRRLLVQRNEGIKRIAESGEWKRYLDN